MEPFLIYHNDLSAICRVVVVGGDLLTNVLGTMEKKIGMMSKATINKS